MQLLSNKDSSNEERLESIGMSALVRFVIVDADPATPFSPFRTSRIAFWEDRSRSSGLIRLWSIFPLHHGPKSYQSGIETCYRVLHQLLQMWRKVPSRQKNSSPEPQKHLLKLGCRVVPSLAVFSGKHHQRRNCCICSIKSKHE